MQEKKKQIFIYDISNAPFNYHLKEYLEKNNIADVPVCVTDKFYYARYYHFFRITKRGKRYGGHIFEKRRKNSKKPLSKDIIDGINNTLPVHFFDYEQLLRYEYVTIPQEITEQMLKYKFTFFNTYCRKFHPCDGAGYSSKNFHQMENLFHLYTNMFYSLFIKHKIDLLYCPHQPHLGSDLIAFRLAEIMDIPRVVFEYIPRIDKDIFFYFHNIEDSYKYKEIPDNPEIDALPHIKIDDLVKHVESYRDDYIDKRRHSFKKSKRGKPMNFKQLFMELKQEVTRKTAIARFYDSKDYFECIKKYEITTVNLDVPFIYFPLHMQPEATTGFAGGEFCDQVLAIEYLSQILPKGWKIYVKENPMQRPYQRSKEFFIRLNGIKDVVLVSRDIPTLDLIKKSKLVSTITGTVGWEAILDKKTVIYFGNIWYGNFDGAYKYNKELDIEKIINTPIDLNLVEEQLNNLRKKAIPALPLYPFRRDPERLKIAYSDENLAKIAKFLMSQIDYFEAKKAKN